MIRVADIVEASGSGDRLKALEALRDYLAKALRDCKSGRDQAALARQLTLVLDAIDRGKSDTDDAFARLTDNFSW